MKKGLFKLAVLFVATFSLIGCGEVDSAAFDRVETVSGRFVDAPVEGLRYECSSGLSGFTDVDGTFDCKKGDDVTFKIGNLSIGSCSVEDVVTPLHLHTGSGNEEKAYNVAQLLHSLDNDGNPSNDIKIDEALLALISLDGVDIEADGQTFQNAMSSAFASVSKTQYDRILAIVKMFSYIDNNDVDVSSVSAINIKAELESLGILICESSEKLLNGECVKK